MKFIFLAIIRMYWFVIPTHRRRKCIFHISCSRYVFNEFHMNGSYEGVKAFLYRYKRCRPGYRLYVNPLTKETEMVLVTGEVLLKKDIATRLVIQR